MEATPEIRHWSDQDEAAKAKRDRMSSPEHLVLLLQDFYDAEGYMDLDSSDKELDEARQANKAYALLGDLVRSLRDVLFANPKVSCYARGTLRIKPEMRPCSGRKCECVGGDAADPSNIEIEPTVDDKGFIDPFFERAKPGVQAVLFKDFRDTVYEFVAKAQKQLDARAQAEQEEQAEIDTALEQTHLDSQ
ncbi:hypothetical protein H4R19_003005 [Coemansia spiralis]|nr:hypothetical protein H4R19_003005 [Coemansia spiralis]